MGSSTFRHRIASPTLIILGVGLALIAAAIGPSPAFAQGSDGAAAEVLFREARELMSEGEFEAACPKFAESQRLDPGVGTLANLALCYEKTKRLASAWASYLEAEAEARKRGERKRARQAAKQAARLEKKLHRLVVVVTKKSSIDKLQIFRDGVEVGRASWGSKVPVDQGDLELKATAPGHIPWTKVIAVGGKKRLTVIEIPKLKEAPIEEPDPDEDPAPDKQTGPTGPTGPTMEIVPGPPWYSDTVAWALIGGGVVLAAGGGLYGLARSDSLKQDAMDANDLEERDDLLDSSDLWKTIGFGAMGVGASVALVGVVKLVLTNDGTERPIEDANASLLDTALSSATVLVEPTSISLGFRF